MTPLKAIENIQDVVGVPSTRYPRNEICGHPECDQPTESVHHIFGRPPGEYADSWFALLPVKNPRGSTNTKTLAKKAIPHAIGLCGTGTTKHHGALEDHTAWIKYEDGVYNWYDRQWRGLGTAPDDYEWVLVGPLDPQPFGWGDKKKKIRKRKNAAERRTRRVISISVPEGFAEGGAVWDDLFGKGKDGIPVGRIRERLGYIMEQPNWVDTRPEFELIVDVCNDWLIGGSGGEA